ncbi:MAG: phosphopentomutase [bacterium]
MIKSQHDNKRAIVLVLDGVGIGEMPDSHLYNDAGSDTLGNLASYVGGFNLPNFEKLGLGKIKNITGMNAGVQPIASYGYMAPASKGKDSTTGHWELMGLITDTVAPLYPNGFPPETVEAIEKAIGKKFLGNIPASGTVIIEELGKEHLKTGNPILYTSADSVFQIAAHKDIIPLEQLYKICEIARANLTGKHQVLRVIARPFDGEPGNFRRTYERRDYGVPPPDKTLLDILSDEGLDVITIGKIDYIFTGRGITEKIHTAGNADGMAKTVERFKAGFNGLLFVNLIDFDMLWGHRNNTTAFYDGLCAVDDWLDEFISLIGDDVPFFITADHGCDPTTSSTDHTREHVPILAYSPTCFKCGNLGRRNSFTDLAQTIAEFFELKNVNLGQSFLGE